MNVMTMNELESVIRALLHKYHAEYALLFGSYARGEATADSDIDVVVFGLAARTSAMLIFLPSVRNCAS